MIHDAKITTRLTLICLAVLAFVAFSPISARAYDEKKCNKSVEKLKKHIKAYRGMKIKTLYQQIDDVDEKEGGWDAKELEDAIDPPFEDLSWAKKFIKYMDSIEKNCTK